MEDKRNIEDSELEKIAGAGEPNQIPSRFATLDAKRFAASSNPGGGGGGAGHPELEDQETPTTDGDQNIGPA